MAFGFLAYQHYYLYISSIYLAPPSHLPQKEKKKGSDNHLARLGYLVQVSPKQKQSKAKKNLKCICIIGVFFT
jgi:hypothetical protein